MNQGCYYKVKKKKKHTSDVFAQTSTCKHAHAVFCLASCKHLQIHMEQEQMVLHRNNEGKMQIASLSCAKSG